MDPTITYLFNPKRSTVLRPVQEYEDVYKQRILELTTNMLENKPNVTLNDSFQSYISDCIRYLKQQDKHKETEGKEKDIAPINGDQFIFAPKKIDVLIKKKQKNMFLIHGKT